MRVLVCAALLAPAFLAGCNDSATCVFTTGCKGGPGAISENAAELPIDGDLIVDGRPDVVRFFPSGNQNPGTTPIVIVFSETMNGSTLLGAIEVVPLAGGGLPGQPVQGLSQALVADGRVLLLLPLSSGTVPGLPAGDYIVRVALEGAEITDLTGQVLDRDAGAQLGNFTVPTTPPDDVRLVATFPIDDATDQSPTTEILAVFDRPVRTSSVTPVSFDVKVDGADPVVDPPAAPVTVQIGANTAPDPRAWVWRSVDGNGLPQSLGTDVEVELRLSPVTSPIVEEDNGELLPSTTTFRTLPFAPPLAASLLSDPSDAIGLANLTPGDLEELTIEVELEGMEPNDAVDVFVFGPQRSEMPDPPLIAIQRTKLLTGTPPIQSVTFMRAEIGIQLSEDPADVRFEDGPITFAFRARRGSRVSPLRVLDLDPDPEVIQDPLLDTAAPAVSALIGSTSTTTFRSDQRGLSLAGQADESLRSVEVTTPLGSNGTLPPVVGSSPTGLFLAAPVPLGRLDAPGTTTFQFAARDDALNSAPSLTGTYTQVGALGPGPWTPGASVAVEVFDAFTFLPIADALVLVHSDEGTIFPFFQVMPTLADGTATVATAGAPSVAAIVTVVAVGYDLFTLHGTPTTRLSIPLTPSSRPPALATGLVRTTDDAAIALLPGLERRFDDTRRPVDVPHGFPGDVCGTTQGVLGCTYGPEPIEPGRLGARSFYAGDFTQLEPGFSAAQLVQAFALTVPLAPAGSNQPQAAELDVPFLLIDATVPPEEGAVPLPAFDFRVDTLSGVDLAMLDDDVATQGVPFATVEVLLPGLGGALAVAPGLTYDRGSGLWTVRAGAPGAITPAGSLGSNGTVDTDPFVRVELRDLLGNSAGARPRLSDILAGAPAAEFRALNVPVQLAPASGGPSGGQAFTVSLAHVIGDERAMGGLYRVRLADAAGRAWELWRFDLPGTDDVAIRVVDPADGGAARLADGSLASTAAAFAWSDLAPLDFLWSDIEREFQLFASAAPVTFSKP